MMYKITILSLILALVTSLNAQAPANDLCSNALPIACGQTIAGDLTNATATPQGSPACINGQSDLWYTFEGDGNAIRITATSATGVDVPGIGILSGASCAEATCLNRIEGSMGDVTSGTIPTTNGQRYYFTVHADGFSNPQAFNLNLECLGAIDVPTNDVCADALFLPIEGASYEDPIRVNTLAANIETGSTGTNCGPSKRDVWFKVARPANGKFNLELRSIANSSAFKMQATLYQTCSFQLFQCEGVSFSSSPGIMEFDVSQNVDTILIRVMSSDFTTNPSDGAFFLDAYFAGLAPNATCATAEAFTVEGQTSCSPQPVQLGPSVPYEVPCTSGLSYNTEWFSIAPPSGFRGLEIRQDQPAQFITILDACDGDVLACGQEQVLQVEANANTPLLMAVSWTSEDTLTSNICVSGLEQLVPNNGRSGAESLPVDSICTPQTFTMGAAELNYGVATCATDTRATQDVHYRIQAPGDGIRIKFDPASDTITYELELQFPNGNPIACISTTGAPIDSLFDDLTAGVTYLLRVVSNSQEITQQYDLCVERKMVSNTSETRSFSNIEVYPNPAHNTLRFKSNAIGQPYSVTNMQGQLVTTGIVWNKLTEVNIQNLPKGMYILNVARAGARIFVIE